MVTRYFTKEIEKCKRNNVNMNKTNLFPKNSIKFIKQINTNSK